VYVGSREWFIDFAADPSASRWCQIRHAPRGSPRSVRTSRPRHGRRCAALTISPRLAAARD
jgi:hypothetical protein